MADVRGEMGYLSCLIEHYSGSYKGSAVMNDLQMIVGDKPYFIVTSNGEGHFELVGFDANRVYEVEGNWLEMRCGKKCHTATNPSMEAIHQMAQTQKDGQILTDMLPRCPKCGAIMELYNAEPPKPEIVEHWNYFLNEYHGKKLVVLELGIGWRNQLIKAPLMRLVAQEENATYISINLGEIYIIDEIKEKSYGLDGYLSEILAQIRENM